MCPPSLTSKVWMALDTAIGNTMICLHVSAPKSQRGLVLLTMFVFVFMVTLGATALVQVHKTQTQREREQQLLFVGEQYKRAIASYYNTIGPGGQRALPQSLDDLVVDRRFPTAIHHLRRIYPDPMTGQADWHVIRSARGISGVRSASESETIKRGGFPARFESFDGKSRYSEWVFAIQL